MGVQRIGTECQMLLRVLTLVFGVVVTCAASELPGNKSYVVKWETSTEKLNWADSRSRCLSRAADLCQMTVLCPPGGKAKDYSGGENWIPLIDAENQWMAPVLNGSISTCVEYETLYPGTKPDWGMADSGNVTKKPWPRSQLACCSEDINEEALSVIIRTAGVKAKMIATTQFLNNTKGNMEADIASNKKITDKGILEFRAQATRSRALWSRDLTNSTMKKVEKATKRMNTICSKLELNAKREIAALERPVDKAKKQFALTQTQEPDVAALVKKTELSHEQRINIFKLVQLHSGDLAIKKAMAEMNAAVADEKITTKDEVPVADMLLF